MQKIGFGGGCHWCTEAVFQSLKGVEKVQQGWISSVGEHDAYSEAVIVSYKEQEIELASLVSIHLYTHSCTSEHSMRRKYRSAVYYFSDEQATTIRSIIDKLQLEFEKPIVTRIIPFVSFKENKEKYLNYYEKNTDGPFCKTYINPKFRLLMQRFSGHIDHDKLKHI